MALYGTAQVRDVHGINDRLDLIAQQIDASQRDPETRAVALSMVSHLPKQCAGWACEDAEVATVFWWVKNNIAYRQDPRDYDLYATAKRTLQVRAGDCDDMVILLGSILAILGYRVGATVISADNRNWHIYTTVGVHSRANPGAYMALDPTQAPAIPGWEPPGQFRKHEIHAVFHGGRVETRKVR